MRSLFIILVGFCLLAVPSFSQEGLNSEVEKELKQADEALSEIMSAVAIVAPNGDTLRGFQRIGIMTYEKYTKTSRFVASILPEGVYAHMRDGEKIIAKMRVTISGRDEETGEIFKLAVMYVAELENTTAIRYKSS